jgi:hypothetical protein
MDTSRSMRLASFLVAALMASSSVFAQQSSAAPAAPVGAGSAGGSVVPRLVNYSGLLQDASGKPITTIREVTFLLYQDAQGGAPVWMETQNVQPDPSGHYSVQLGSTQPSGLPVDLFSSGEARWLGVQVQGQAEQPRGMLLAVPYALKALDAQTLGGMPVSAFMTAPNSSAASGSTTGNGSGAAASRSSALSSAPALSGAGKKDHVPLWLSTSKLGNSVLFQSTAGNVGVGTTTPTATLDVKGTVNATTSYNLGRKAFAFGSYSTGNAFLGFSGNITMTGTDNTANGFKALALNTTGYLNTASGESALQGNTTGAANTANGFWALQGNTTGQVNTAIGFSALYSNTTGINNTASGSAALYANTTGHYNTASGESALFYNTSGLFNTALGYHAGPDSKSPNLNNATAIGAFATVSESNALVLGGTGSNAVNVGIGTAAPTEPLDVVGSLKLEGSGNGITFPDGTIQTTAALTAALTVTSVIQNYTGSTHLSCASGYVVVLANCTVGGFYSGSVNQQAGGAAVYNDSRTPLPPGATAWANYLTPSVSNATGVHCDLGAGSLSSQASLRCAK